MNGAARTTSELWLAAISGAERREASEAADYLRVLNDVLQDQKTRGMLNDPPDCAPPRPLWEQRSGPGNVPYYDPYAHQPQVHSMGQPNNAAPAMPAPAARTISGTANANQNPYSVFGGGNDSDSEGSDEISDEEIVYQTPSNTKSPIDDKHMSNRRILLRVYCSLAELHSMWAIECSQQKRWTAGADEFEAAFNTLRLGQSILDEEHARLAQATEALAQYGHGDAARAQRDIDARKECAARDSEIVAVPLAFFSSSKDRFVHAAEKRISYLEDKLFAENSSRADKMAESSSWWTNNPNPSHDYAEKRKMIEKELDEALEGMNRTRKLNVIGDIAV
ncbi:hypothetical protein ACHAXT_006523 [Thalassiosira profunda]